MITPRRHQQARGPMKGSKLRRTAISTPAIPITKKAMALANANIRSD